MGGWALAVNILFPIPLVFLLLLCTPLPKFMADPIRKYTNIVIDRVFMFNIIGGITVYQFAILLSTMLFLSSANDTVKLTNRVFESRDTMAEERSRCLKWRGERNLWISAFSLVLWLILYRIHVITQELQNYKVQTNRTQHAHTD